MPSQITTNPYKFSDVLGLSGRVRTAPATICAPIEQEFEARETEAATPCLHPPMPLDSLGGRFGKPKIVVLGKLEWTFL